ncbi:hypothetical protein C2845_PM12G05820 [Panicum miliaceum]|uniref:Uncharacterized protein n=1 Tax=Panicum miliaceum TaxID=4540 RepID=A0A3L6QIU9_PANMI|nr:hypothetical protein C2845_PM12G05820 [Panicum miliaceum]
MKKANKPTQRQQRSRPTPRTPSRSTMAMFLWRRSCPRPSPTTSPGLLRAYPRGYGAKQAIRPVSKKMAFIMLCPCRHRHQHADALAAASTKAMADECLSEPPTSIDNSDPQSKHSYI